MIDAKSLTLQGLPVVLVLGVLLVVAPHFGVVVIGIGAKDLGARYDCVQKHRICQDGLVGVQDPLFVSERVEEVPVRKR